MQCYRRSIVMDCSQKVAVVLGGAGNIGSCVVRSFLKRGYGKVAAVSRSPAKLESLKNQLGADVSRVALIVGDVSSESGAESAKNEILEQCNGRIDDVVSVMGTPLFYKTTLREQPPADLEKAFHLNALLPFIAYKIFIPTVKDNPNGSYTFVTGGGYDVYAGPGSGLLIIGGGASRGVAIVAGKEHINDAVAVSEFSIRVYVSPSQDQAPPGVPWASSQVVGDAIASVAANKLGKIIIVSSPDDVVKVIKEKM